MLDELSTIANEFFCEKYTLCGYTVHYDKFLNSMRNKKFNMLEIGVSDGRSLRMWEKYFPNATIYAIDTDPECLSQASTRSHVYNINQCDKPRLIELCEYIGELDLVCDDGSHIGSDIVDSFNTIFPYLTDGGYYIIEDILPEHKSTVYPYLENFNIVHKSQAEYYKEEDMIIIRKEIECLN